MIFDFSKLDAIHRYKLLASTIVPRPIAWVSTTSADGLLNAAPFSFFNVFSEEPAVIGFSIGHRSSTDRKDTGENIRSQKEFVVNLVSEDNVQKMNVSAIEFAADVGEFAEAGLTAAPSFALKTPRIAQSQVSFECQLMQIIPLGELRSLVLGEVVAMHVKDEAVIDPDRCWIDTPKLKLVGRMHASSYIRTSDLFELLRITVQEWFSSKKGINDL
jgi:flavin reductase (DIM6/NTAB) family NADH-FMN oxidoreductase RutF